MIQNVIFRTTRRPLLLFLCFLFSCVVHLSTKAQSCTLTDSLALLDLYNATSGLNWDITQPYATWQGISVDANKCVTRIQLDAAMTGGVIPSQLGSIEYLLELDLEDCNLTGPIPSSLGGLFNLVELDLEGNQLTGSIPASLASLPNLNELVLIDNNLSGCYLPQLFSLCTISDGNNQISDGNNFDGAWFNFCVNESYACASCREQDSITLLTILDGFANVGIDTSGPISDWSGISLNSEGCIISIDFDDCCVSGGVLVSEIGNLASLEYLDLDENDVGGTIPSEIGNLTNLTYLDLSENGFSGIIPNEISNLIQLEYLNLGENLLEGEIPEGIGNLVELYYLNLCGNNLNGTIPNEIGNLIKLQLIYLFDNNLTGGIPAQFGELINLEGLFVKNNDLSGCYPESLLGLCESLIPINNNDHNISEGNNFDASWGEFCLYQEGVCVDCAITDSLALIELYNSTTGLNWNLNSPISTWQGISVDTNGCVKRIQLDGLLSGGTIPHQLNNIANLIELDLEDCQLTGQIPSSLGELNKLVELDLEGNQLTGSIPLSFADLASLEELVLIDNELSGCYFPEIQSLCDVTSANSQISNGNNFDGSWSAFCGVEDNACAPCRVRDSLTLISVLDSFESHSINTSLPLDTWSRITLNESGCVVKIDWDECCVYGGTLAPEIGDLHALEFFRMSEGLVGGTLPPELGNLSNLKYLFIIDNAFTGSIPSEFGNLYNLEFMNLKYNMLESIPPEIANLSALKYMLLDKNNLQGSIPVEIGDMESLRSLGLDHNYLSGSIPVELTTAPNLSAISLRNNLLENMVPIEIENLTSLIFLDLSYNKLEGEIPKEFGSLANLQSLYLSGNNLSGSIPVEMGNLMQLNSLELANNNLSGCYPQELSFLCDNLSFYSNSNTSISDGNNFEASWEDFCNASVGICGEACPDTIDISNVISTDQTMGANISINSNAQIVSGASRFSAGQCVLLSPEFEVSVGAVFTAEIESCQ